MIMDSDRTEPSAVISDEQCSMMECFSTGNSNSSNDNMDLRFYANVDDEDPESLIMETINGNEDNSSNRINETNFLQDKIAAFTMDDNVLWFKQPDLFKQNQDGEKPISREHLKWLLETRLAYVNLMLAALDYVDERKKKSSTNVASRWKATRNNKKFRTKRS